MIPTEEQQKDQALILNLTEREKIALDAYIFNPSNKIGAYKIARNIPEDSNLDIEMLRQRATGWVNQKGSRAYLLSQKGKITGVPQTYLSDDEQISVFDKEQLAKLLSQTIMTTTDAKLKADLVVKLADLQGYKKEKTEKEEKRVRYYLPLKCEKCEFFKNKLIPQDKQSIE